MRSNFRPDMAGAARSAMRCIGQVRQRTRYEAKIDLKGGQTMPVARRAAAGDVAHRQGSATMSTGFVWPFHDASLCDGGC